MSPHGMHGRRQPLTRRPAPRRSRAPRAAVQGYSSGGSVYQASVVFLPLGLPANDSFWTAPEMPTSWERIWDGKGELTRDAVVR
jgi:hypothetical protein